MAFGMNQGIVNPFLIGNIPPNSQQSDILQMALAANQPPDNKLAMMNQNATNQIVNEDINKNVTDTSVLQKMENVLMPSAQAAQPNQNQTGNVDEEDMEAKATKYAQWIVANKDKKGTKEFETVVRAYKAAKSRINPKNKMSDAALASITKLLPANVAGGFSSLVDLTLEKFGDDLSQPIKQTLTNLSSDASSFQNELLSEVTEVYKGRPDEIPSSILQGLQAGDYGGAIQALGYGVSEGIGTSAPSFVAGLIKRYPAVALLSTAPNALMLMEEKVAEKKEKGLDPTLNAQDLLVVAGQLGFDLIPMKKNFFKDMVKEASVETGQDAATIISTTMQGAEYQDYEIAEDLFESFVIGGATQGTFRTASRVGGAVTPNFVKRIVGGNPNQTPFQQSANEKAENRIRSDLANNLNDMSNNMGANLKDTDRESTVGARAVMDNVQRDLSTQIQSVANTIKNSISPTGANSKTLAVDKIIERAKAQSAIARSKNKVKNTVTDADFDRIRTLAPRSARAETETLINLMQQSNELTKLQAGGVKGGVSRLTDELMPFGKTSNYLPSGVAGGLRPMLAIGAGLATSGVSTAIQLGAVGGGRVADFATGNRSPVNKFVKQFKGGKGSPDYSKLPSIAQARLEGKKNAEAQFQKIRQQSRAANVNIPDGIDNQLNDLGILPVEQDKGMKILLNEGSITKSQYDKFYKNPMDLEADNQGFMAIRAGLNRLAQLGRINQSPATAQQNQQAIQQIQQTNNQQQQQQSPQQQPQPQPQLTKEQREDGRNKNQKFLDNMADKVDAKEKGVTKAVMLDALEKFRLMSGRRGSSIVQEANRIYLEAFNFNPKAANRYLFPYVKRVERQQSNIPLRNNL